MQQKKQATINKERINDLFIESEYTKSFSFGNNF